MLKYRKQVLLLTTIGAGIEFYDFAVFAFFAGVIGKLYFNMGNATLSLVAGYAVFGIGTLARLIGGVIFSYFGDKYGRKITFIYTVFFMTVPSLCIVILPTYHQIGLLAPFLLILCRVLQGFAAGGELPTAITLIAENFSAKNCAFACSFLLMGIFSGFLCASVTQSILNQFLSMTQIEEYGWRFAYLLGGCCGIIGIIIRAKLKESHVFLAMQEKQQVASNPILFVLTHFRKKIIACFLFNIVVISFVYIFYTFLPIYYATHFDFDAQTIRNANSIGIACSILSIFFIGYLTLFINKKIIYLSGCIIFFIMTYPLLFIAKLSPYYLFLSYLLIGLFSGTILSPPYAILVEQFPPKVRITGVGLSLNLATIFGACGAEFCMLLAKLTHNVLAPAYFIMGCSIISCLGLYLLNENKNRRLGNDLMPQSLIAI